MIDRVVVWFSAGVTSAVALKLALDKYRGSLPVVAAYCDTGSEHEDNARFMRDVEQWLGVTVVVLRGNYSDTFAVYRSSGFIKNTFGAKCTYELKKLPRRQFEQLATDLQVFGYDASEHGRAQRFMDNNPEVNTWFPLIDEGITKDEARHILKLGGIQEPITYSLGFNNANCLRTGCVKGGMGYWNHMRRVFPDTFWRMAALEREIGHAICSHEKRGPDGERVKVPVYLDELDPIAGNYNTEPAFQCGLFCGQY